jgi:hypothetical protein
MEWARENAQKRTAKASGKREPKRPRAWVAAGRRTRDRTTCSHPDRKAAACISFPLRSVFSRSSCQRTLHAAIIMIRIPKPPPTHVNSPLSTEQHSTAPRSTCAAAGRGNGFGRGGRHDHCGYTNNGCTRTACRGTVWHRSPPDCWHIFGRSRPSSSLSLIGEEEGPGRPVSSNEGVAGRKRLLPPHSEDVGTDIAVVLPAGKMPAVLATEEHRWADRSPAPILRIWHRLGHLWRGLLLAILPMRRHQLVNVSRFLHTNYSLVSTFASCV